MSNERSADGVASNYGADSDFGRVPNHSVGTAPLGVRADSGIEGTSSGGYPSFGEPLPGVDNLVTVQELRAVIQEQNLWVGPMASPETLGQYETVVPGMAERLLRVHESQTVQVADREDRIVASDIELAKGGQGWAGFLALICVVPAIVMLFTGNLAGGAILLSMPVTLLVASFIPRSKTKA